MRYAFIQASLEDSELKDIPIAKRCEVLEVSVSGYHAWVKRQRMPVKCKKVISDETVLRQAKIIRNEMKYTPGTVKCTRSCVKEAFASESSGSEAFACQRHHRVPSFQTYCQNDRQQSQHVCLSQPLRARFCSRNTQQSMGERHHVLAHDPRMGILGYHLDLGSRRILGWAMDTSMTTDLVLRALNMAVRTRGSNAVAGTIMHSDRGTQYCSDAFQNRLMQLDMR